MDLDLDHRGSPVHNMVAQPVDDYVIGVQVSSRPWILPRVETPSGPPEIPQCHDRHIVRTREHVVAVDVTTRVTVYPRSMTMDEVRASVRETLAEEEPESLLRDGCEVGLEAMAHRLACGLQEQGVEIL